MFSNPTKPRSIATQLILLFTLAAAILLGCALGGFYWLVLRHALAEDNAVLADKVGALLAELKEPDGIAGIDQELKSRRAGEPAVYWVRIIGPEFGIETETVRMSEIVPLRAFPVPTESRPSFPKNYRAGPRLFALVAANETVNGRLYTIQVAQDRSEDERFRAIFGSLLLVTLAIGTLAFAAIATTVVNRGLRPLRQMTRLVGRVSSAHLNEHLTTTGWPPELQPLAVAFDDMLVRLEDSFTRLSQFSADIAHELRTPIANLLGEAQVGLSRARPAQEYREIIESSVAECERLAGIIDNLLFLARAEAAPREIQRSVFDARSAIEKIAAYYQPVAEERAIILRCLGQGQLFADPVLFNRALNNLVENALRFAPDGSEITIAINAEASATQVSVKDTGAGIPSEHLPRIFDRFYRVDPSRSPAGSGLGLALVKSILDLHGGSAQIRSEVGRGTDVILTFPNRPAAQT
jgi:two-component system, OmpR family, heavy metal sensor histidine kinase CusS